MQIPPFVRNYLGGEAERLEGDEGRAIAEYIINKIAGSDKDAKERLMIIGRLFSGEVLSEEEQKSVMENYFGGGEVDFSKSRDVAFDIVMKMEKSTPEVGKTLMAIGNLFSGKELETEEREALWLFAKEN